MKLIGEALCTVACIALGYAICYFGWLGIIIQFFTNLFAR